MANVPIAVGYALALVLLVAAMGRAWMARPRPGAAWLVLTTGGAAWWAAFSLGLALTSPERGAVWTLLGRMEWFGIPLAALGVFGLGMSLSGRARLLDRRLVGLVLLAPFVSAVMGLSHPDVVGLVADSSAPLAGALAAMEPYAPLYVWLAWMTVVEVYLLLAVGTLLLLESTLERPTVQPGRLLVLAMVLPPWGINVLYLTGVIPYNGFDPTVLGFVPTGIAGVLAVGRFELFAAPLARSQMVEELDTPVLTVSDDGRLYDYNDQARALFALDADDAPGTLTALFELRVLDFDRELPAETEATVQRIDGQELSLETGPSQSTAIQQEDAGPTEPAGEPAVPDDAPRRYLLDVTELGRARGQRLGYAVQLVDITVQSYQRERLHEQNRRIARKNEQLERLASVVSHDLETPLSTGRGLVDLLRIDLEEPDAEVEQSLDDLDRVFESLTGFAEHLPRLAKESVDVESPDLCDLESIARDAWNVVDTGDLELRVEATRPIRADPRRLQQVFENFFQNTVAHATTESRPAGDTAGATPSDTRVPDSQSDGFGTDGLTTPGSPEVRTDEASVVRVGVLAGDDSPDSASGSGFFVADDGPGIDPARRDDVLSFGDGDGTGYGLAIVRTIVEAHGWTVSITESSDGGVRFDISGLEPATP